MGNGSMTPPKLKRFYGVDDDTGSSDIVQSIFSSQQTWDLNDLRLFRERFKLDGNATPENVSPTQYPNCSLGQACQKQDWKWIGMYICGEASLDVQYITGVSQG